MLEAVVGDMWLLTQVTQVAPGGMHSVALTPDGEVYTTGVNDEGALGRESGTNCSLMSNFPVPMHMAVVYKPVYIAH